MNWRLLFKQRQVWLPTWQGWLFILGLVTLVAFFLLKNVALFLSEQAPVKSQYLIVEGWLDETGLRQAWDEFNQHDYKLLITTGGPEVRILTSHYANYAEQAAAELQAMGLSASNLLVVPTPASAQNRTYLSAVMVRRKLDQMHIVPTSLNVFSDSVHARRSHLLYQIAFRQTATEIGILAAQPERFSLTGWWRTSDGAKTVITELVGWLWAKCCFQPGEVGSHQEMWGQDKLLQKAAKAQTS